MKFNKFIWNLYISSEQGEKALERWIRGLTVGKGFRGLRKMVEDVFPAEWRPRCG
jgi:hypothetical protein